MLISESEFIHQLRQGKESAYRELYIQHYELLCRVAYAFLSDKHLAESVVNQLIADVWEKRTALLFTSPLRAYLVKAVRNRCINYLQSEYVRRETRWTDAENSLGDLVTDAYPTANLLGRELEAELIEAIGKLSPECRRVFELSRFNELSHAEIADELSISVNTVKYHIRNALARLREDLADFLIFILFFFFFR
jgi:RNA polymerase sigma-70 factor (ECF subfamily)